MVSVAIPVYNGEEYLARALDSVYLQTTPPDEVIVLDDGSTDGTAEVAARYPVRLIRQDNQGIGPARRKLVEEAKGDWIAFLDHDDFWGPDKLAMQMPLTSEDRLGLIHTRDVFFYGSLEEGVVGKWSPHKNALALDHVLPDCRVNMSSALVRRQALMEAGNFDEGVSKAEDWLMWLRIAASWDIAFVPRPLTWTYKHAGSASTPNASWYEAERSILEDLVLPRFDELYSRFPPEARLRYRAAIQVKLGAIASLKAEALDGEGRRSEARALHLKAIKQSPLRKGAWLRFAKHFKPSP